MGIMFAILKQKNTTVLHLAKIPNVVSNNKQASGKTPHKNMQGTFTTSKLG